MEIATPVELKNQAGHLLRRVMSGEPVIVTFRFPARVAGDAIPDFTVLRIVPRSLLERILWSLD